MKIIILACSLMGLWAGKTPEIQKKPELITASHKVLCTKEADIKTSDGTNVHVTVTAETCKEARQGIREMKKALQ
jgi:hypothetical protein